MAFERSVWRIFLIFLILLFCRNAFSQNIRFDNFSLAQGLSQSTIVSLLQDRKGFLWIGTQDGLNRFDGYNFKIFKKEKDNPQNSLGGNFIWDLFEDKDGTIWIAHDGGISSYNPTLDSFSSFLVEGGATTVRSLHSDSSENGIWLGTSGQGLFYFERSSKKIKNYVNDSKNNLAYNNILDIAQNITGELLIGTRGAGLFLFSIEKGFFRPNSEWPDVSLMSENDVWKIQSEKGYLWLGTRKGLVKLTENCDFIDAYSLSENLLTPKRVSTFLFGKDGHIWIATYGGGLVDFNTATESYETYLHSDNDPLSIAHDLVFSLLFDRSGNLWVGTWLGGLSKIRNSYLNFNGYTNANVNSPSNFVTTITSLPCEESETLLVGTYGGGIQTARLDGQEIVRLEFTNYKKLTLTSPVILINFLYRGNDKLWIGTDDQGVIGLPLERVGCKESLRNISLDLLNKNVDKSLSNPVKAIAEDKVGNLWVGTIGGGATRISINGNEKTATNYTFKKDDSLSLSHNRVNHILIDKEANVWLSTSNGLNLFNGLNFQRFLAGKIITMFQDAHDHLFIGSEDGLYLAKKENLKYFFTKIPELDGYLINSIQEDNNRVLWISTNNGLIQYKRQNRETLNFKSSDGLIDNEYNYNASAISKNGNLYFGGVNGLTAFNPNKILLNSHVPEVVITTIRLNNREIPLKSSDKSNPSLNKNVVEADQLELSYNQNNLSFQFSAMDFTNPSKNRFEYKLDGFDKDWVRTDAINRTATYTNLSPGNYTFRVKGSNNDGLWNEKGAIISIIIAPPMWRTWWAYSGYMLVLIGLLFVGRKAIVNRERLKAQVLVEQKEKQTLRELDHLKTKFFSNITHEFRTPLTLIQGPANELLEKITDAESQKLLTMIKNNSHRLLALINQLLDLAKIDANEMKLNYNTVRLDVFLKTIVSQFTSLASSRQIQLAWQLPTEFTTVLMDKGKIETILINLISNAVKFTPANGHVMITANVAANKLEIQVRDDGRGIPAEKLAYIFNRFYQVEATDSSHAEGTGIGLALVKEYVELMRGIVNVESEVGVGTIFKIVVPVTIAPREPIAEAISIIGDSSTSEEGSTNADLPLLLIVEDNEDIRSLIKMCLGNQYRFAEARHGREGLDRARTEIPDLIISDLMMPEMDGIELCREIKKDGRTNHIPFIMLTAKAAEESKLEGLQTGADDYIIKPFNRTEVALKVHNLVMLREKLQTHIKNNLLSQATPIVAQSASEEFIVKAKTYIETHLADDLLSVETLASELSLSREQCYRKIVALTGLSPSAFIRKLRLQKASQLLVAKRGTISQIAYEVGFENLSYFSKAFKEEFGKLPSEY